MMNIEEAKRLLEIATLTAGAVDSISKANNAVDRGAELHWLRAAAWNLDEANRRMTSFLKVQEEA